MAVGFGIATADQARQVRDWGADGAIVGSALVKVMAAAAATAPQGPAPATATAAAKFCAELRAALDH